MTRLDYAIDQIRTARAYTNELLASVDPRDWFRIPNAGVSHIGWQVGHLAFAQFRLPLQRVRGDRPGDELLFSPAMFELFGARSEPKPDPAAYPPAAEIRAVFDRVHEQVMRELPTYTDATLDEPTARPHPLFTTKFGALTWCCRHEMLHAGQIGLLRRQLGAQPKW